VTELQDRVCVVTGAAGGIGLGIAEAYAGAGASVALVDLREDDVRREADRLRADGHCVAAHGLDISCREAVFEAFRLIRKDLGPVYALVNSAGVVDQRPFTEITPEQRAGDALIGRVRYARHPSLP